MADVALLALGLDTSQLKSGESQSVRSLQAIEREMAKAEKQSEQLSRQLRGQGGSLKSASQDWAQLATSVRSGVGALAGVGGPVGSAAGKIEGLRAQVGGLVEVMGVGGGIAVGFAAALGAVAASFVKLSIDGSRLADETIDVAEGTGLSIDSVQRLGLAMQRSGENISGVERAFRQFQSFVTEAIQNPSEESARKLRILQVTAEEAGRDMGGAFVKSLSALKEIRSTTEGAVVSNEAFGRGIGALVRSSDAFAEVMKKSRRELQDTGQLAGDIALGNAAKLDDRVNHLSTAFDQLKIAMNGVGGSAVAGVFEAMARAMESLTGWLNKAAQSPFWSQLGNKAVAQLFGLSPGAGPALAALGGAGKPLDITGSQNAGPFGNIVGLRDPLSTQRTAGGGGRSQVALTPSVTASELSQMLQRTEAYYDAWKKVAESFYSAQLITFQEFTDRLTTADEGMREAQIQNARNVEQELQQQLSSAPAGTDIGRITSELSKVREELAKLGVAAGVVVLPQVERLTENLRSLAESGVTPLITSSRPRTVETPHPDDIIAPQGTATRPRTVTDKQQNREILSQEFNYVITDFLRVLATGRATLGEAFQGLVLGFLDTFTTALIQSMQKSFIDPLVNGLTNLLTSALDGLFGNLSGGFGGVLGGIGKFFAGLFADGGTIPAGKFGIVGERGPEFAFAGSRPMTITPMGAMAGGGGINLNVSFAVNSSNGQLSQRSQDQMADQVFRAVQRAQRNKGA